MIKSLTGFCKVIFPVEDVCDLVSKYVSTTCYFSVRVCMCVFVCVYVHLCAVCMEICMLCFKQFGSKVV